MRVLEVSRSEFSLFLHAVRRYERERECVLCNGRTFSQGAELFLGRQVPAANGARQAVMPRPYLQNKSRSLPSRQPLEPRALFAFLRREESEARRKNGHDSSVDESSLSSDTSCSSLEYHRPQSAGVELPRTSLRSSPVRSDEAKRPGAFPSSKGSTESLSRRERLQAAKARVEAQRSRYGGSSSEEDEDDGNKPTDVNKNRKRSRDVPAFTRLGPVWQESKAYQDPTMVRRGSPGVPLSVSTTFQGPTGPVQPSPQDSGVSSQSVASSPSLGRAPTPPPRRCQSRALLRESPLLAPKPRRHSASFELCRLDDSGFGSERRESFYNYGGMPPAHEVKPRARGPAYYSYTDQAPVHQDSSGAYMSDPQRPDGRFVGLAPRHRRASISAEVLDLAPKSDMPPRRPRPLSMVMEKTRDVPPPVPRHKPQMGGTTNSLEVARRRLDDVMQRERERRSSANLETALNELEEIYQSLRLNEDEDLLFRAERRDLPTKFQLSRPDSNTTFVEPTYPLKRSCSDDISAMSGHQPRQRAPSFRRSAVPDKLTDDLAYRRLVQQPQPPQRNGARTPTPRKDASYLLYSPAFTPSLQVDPALLDFTLSKEPDIEKDDMSYRNYTQADAIRVPAPQPPFGIPLLPTQGTSCDYLRARPSDAQRPLTRPKVHPDLVRDDMAFRNLRKDPAVSLASRRPTLFVNINSDPSEKRDKSQSMTSVMEALHRESQRWKRLDESVQSPQSGPSSASSLRSSGPNWGLARQRGRIVPMEDSQLDSLLASLTPPPVSPGERLRTGVRVPA